MIDVRNELQEIQEARNPDRDTVSAAALRRRTRVVIPLIAGLIVAAVAFRVFWPQARGVAPADAGCPSDDSCWLRADADPVA
jgi:hypothetical protein